MSNSDANTEYLHSVMLDISRADRANQTSKSTQEKSFINAVLPVELRLPCEGGLAGNHGCQIVFDLNQKLKKLSLIPQDIW